MTDADDAYAGSRRAFFVASGGALLLAACRGNAHPEPSTAASTTAAARKKGDERGHHDEHEDEEEVSAVEDLMREHGAIRRVLVVYRESAARLRTKPGSVPPDALQRAAKLIRTFGEDYHEKQLEEVHVFPALQKAAGARGGVAAEIATLLAQHQRGRELTDWVIAVTQRPIGAATVEPLARALEGFAWMYESHAAREDTIVFPAWKKTLSKKAVAELGEQFEEIEKKTFGKDGFDMALEQISTVEAAIGLDPASFLPPAPAPLRP